MSARIGTMRHRLHLEMPQSTPDGAGGADVTWLPVASLWGSLRPLSANEGENGDGIASHVTHEIVTRHRDGVTAAMRFVKGARVFAIRSVVDPFETGVWLKCLVEEKTI